MEKVRTSILEKEKINSIEKLEARRKLSPFKNDYEFNIFNNNDPLQINTALNASKWYSKSRTYRYDFYIPSTKIEEFMHYLEVLSSPPFLVNVDFDNIKYRIRNDKCRWLNYSKDGLSKGRVGTVNIQVCIEGSSENRDRWDANMTMINSYLNENYDITYKKEDN